MYSYRYSTIKTANLKTKDEKTSKLVLFKTICF